MRRNARPKSAGARRFAEEQSQELCECLKRTRRLLLASAAAWHNAFSLCLLLRAPATLSSFTRPAVLTLSLALLTPPPILHRAGPRGRRAARARARRAGRPLAAEQTEEEARRSARAASGRPPCHHLHRRRRARAGATEQWQGGTAALLGAGAVGCRADAALPVGGGHSQSISSLHEKEDDDGGGEARPAEAVWAVEKDEVRFPTRVARLPSGHSNGIVLSRSDLQALQRPPTAPRWVSQGSGQGRDLLDGLGAMVDEQRAVRHSLEESAGADAARSDAFDDEIEAINRELAVARQGEQAEAVRPPSLCVTGAR